MKFLEKDVYNKNSIPLLRIKKIMKKQTNVKLISYEVPILMCKAIELFIIDFTFRASAHMSLDKRKTLRVSFLF